MFTFLDLGWLVGSMAVVKLIIGGYLGRSISISALVPAFARLRLGPLGDPDMPISYRYVSAWVCMHV